jgi:dGTPase
MAMSNDPSYNYCAVPLASYACRADQSVGRLFDEDESEHRTCFQRDRDRIIHASAFRRLKYKTQVFVYSHGDNFRTRLTHTLEVSQIARTLARALHANEDLAEVVALAHDLGHAPFAHTGEEALLECMQAYGGFEHNDQSLRIVTTLEDKYPSFEGLNLTWETLEGIVKHNGPVKGTLPYQLSNIQKKTDLRLNTFATLEAQIAAISDDIAYNNHDVQDGLAAGLFTIDDLKSVPLMADIIDEVKAKWPNLLPHKFNAEVIRVMIGAMVENVMHETQKRLSDQKIKNVEDIRNAKIQIVQFSSVMFEKVQELRQFLWDHMYKHYTVNRMRYKAERIIGNLFNLFLDRPECLPNDWQTLYETSGTSKSDQARLICDYIAGMTDRFAIVEHDRLFDLSVE